MAPTVVMPTFFVYRCRVNLDAMNNTIRVGLVVGLKKK